MIVKADECVVDTHRSEVISLNGTRYFCVGFIYSPGHRAGTDSVRFVAQHFERTGTVPFSQLRGSFSMFIVSDDHVLAFADNSGLSTVFVHKHLISDRFLPLIQQLASTEGELEFDWVAVAQTYAIGRVLSERTVIDSVTMLDKYHYVEVRGGRIQIHHKGISDIDATPSDFSPTAFFDSLATALADTRISCALTGGYDSRLVFTFLSNRAPVQPTLSGDIPDTSEARVGARVAEAAGTKLNFVNTPKPTIDQDMLERLFWDQDGAAGFSSDSAIRLFDFYAKLQSQGHEMHFTGDGGVLHKDWEWIQDFPFYQRKKTNLERFYEHRLGFNFDARGAGPAIERTSRTMRTDTLARLRRYLMRTNTQSYDMLYYHVNGRRTVYYNPDRHGLRLYAPLLEHDFVAYSYSLPRFQRFFNNSIRSMTTAQQARIARIPTVYGTTASSEARYVFRDVLFQVVDYGRRATRLLGRKLLGRTPMLEPVISWSAEADLRLLPLAVEAVKYCRDIGVVSSEESLETLSRQHIDAAIQIFFVGRVAGLARPSPRTGIESDRA